MRILIDKERFKEKLRKISLGNENITKFGDGFEKAMDMVFDALEKEEETKI